MVLFRQVFLERKQQVLALTDLKLLDLIRVMNSSDFNVVSLTADRILYYDKDFPGRYEIYDLNVLETSDEIIESVMLLKLDPSKIEESVRRKSFLLQHMFSDVKTAVSSTEVFSSSGTQYSSSTDEISQVAIQLSDAEIHSEMDAMKHPDDQLVSMDSLLNLSADSFIETLADDSELATNTIDFESAVSVAGDANQEQHLSYVDQMLINNQRLMLSKVSEEARRFVLDGSTVFSSTTSQQGCSHWNKLCRICTSDSRFPSS